MFELRTIISFALLIFFWITAVHATVQVSPDLPISRALKNELLNQQPRIKYASSGNDFPVFARLVDTLSFASHLEQCHFCLVAFFEPNSQSFLETRFELDLAAKVLKRISLRNNGLGLLLVDATKDSYLQHVYAKEMRYSWQAKKNFGPSSNHNKQRISFYPTIIKLFKEGQMVEEYTGPIEMESLVHFVTLKAFEGIVTTIEDLKQWKQELDYPAIVCCGGDCENVTSSIKDYPSVFMYRMNSIELCQELIHGDEEKSLENKGVYLLMPNSEPKLIVSSSNNRGSKLGVSLLKAMTPDNSWKFMLKGTEYLVIHLIAYTASDYPLKQYSNERTDLMIQQQVFEAFEIFEKEFDYSYNKIQFVQVDGRIFGEEFNVQEFPSLVIYQLGNGGGKQRRPPRVMKLISNNSSLMIKQEEIVLFLKEYFRSVVFENENIQKEDENDSTTTITGLYFRIHTLLRRAMLMDETSSTSMSNNNLLLAEGIVDILRLDPIMGEKSYVDFIKLIWFSTELGKTIKDKNKLKQLKFGIEQLQRFQSELASLNDYDDPQQKMKMNQTLNRLNEFILIHQSSKQQQKKTRYQEIDRVHESNLTLKDFLLKYSKAKRPILISGLNPFKKGFEWTLERIQQVCGSFVPSYARRETNSSLWGELVVQKHKNNMTLSEFISRLSKNYSSSMSNECGEQQLQQQKDDSSKLYVHDFSVPVFCPDLLGGPPFDLFKLPRFIAGDLLQRIPFDSYKHSWPSLFIGGNETSSGLHVDAGATSFVMYLMQGRKMWTVFHPSHIGRLGLDPLSERFTRVTDEILFGEEQLDNINVDLDSNKEIFRGIQYPGEMMFIPGNSPHAVKNLDEINLGWSMNVVDIGNKVEHLRHLLMTNKFKEFDSFVDPKRKLGMTSKLRDLTFGEFKSYRWEEIYLDLYD